MSRMVATDQHVEGDFVAGGMQHKLLLGVDALRFKQTGEAGSTPDLQRRRCTADRCLQPGVRRLRTADAHRQRPFGPASRRRVRTGPDEARAQLDRGGRIAPRPCHQRARAEPGGRDDERHLQTRRSDVRRGQRVGALHQLQRVVHAAGQSQHAVVQAVARQAVGRRREVPVADDRWPRLQRTDVRAEGEQPDRRGHAQRVRAARPTRGRAGPNSKPRRGSARST